MLKLFYKVILLFSVLLIIGEVAWKFIDVPYYWGNVNLNTKLEFLKEKKITPNIYFIGSSVTFRQVMPTLFDSIANKNGRSFNLGVDGTFAPQTYFLLEHLIETAPTIDYLLVELNGHDYFAQNFRTTESKYYLSPKWLSSFYNYINQASVSIGNKLGIGGMYFYAYLEKVFGIGMRANYLKQIHEKNIDKARGVTGRQNDGFYPLGAITPNKLDEKQLPAELKRLEAAFQLAYQEIAEKRMPYNQALKEQLEYYISFAKKKEIQLIYILNPIESVFDTPSEMVALFQDLPVANRIDLANPSKFSELYLLENRWDKNHLSTKGSAIFSKKLAKAFNDLTN